MLDSRVSFLVNIANNLLLLQLTFSCLPNSDSISRATNTLRFPLLGGRPFPVTHFSSNNRLIATRPSAQTRPALPRMQSRFAYNRASHGFDVSLRAFPRLLFFCTRVHVSPVRVRPATLHLTNHMQTRQQTAASHLFLSTCWKLPMIMRDACPRARITIQLLLFIATVTIYWPVSH